MRVSCAVRNDSQVRFAIFRAPYPRCALPICTILNIEKARKAFDYYDERCCEILWRQDGKPIITTERR
jgi:hypothetical protein